MRKGRHGDVLPATEEKLVARGDCLMRCCALEKGCAKVTRRVRQDANKGSKNVANH